MNYSPSKVFHVLLSAVLCLIAPFLYADEPKENFLMSARKNELDPAWNTVLRARALAKFDKFLDLVFPSAQRGYKLCMQQTGSHFVMKSEEIIEFSKNYNFFSKIKPIIANFTQELEDIDKSCQLLKMMVKYCKHSEFLRISTAEILSKVIAFRNLKKDMLIFVPYVGLDGRIYGLDYRVDKIFDLWLGMPAFGLVDDKGIGSPILLYRGTDISLNKKRGWASIFSDLDIKGPGLNAFLNARKEISSWLKENYHQDKKTRVYGYSLGGVLTTYTMLYETQYVDFKQSMSFSPPGVSAEIYSMWMMLDENIRSDYRVFVSHGDLIPKVGKMVGKAFEHSLEFYLRPLDAHVRLMCCQPDVYQFLIDVDRENKEGR